MPQYRTPFPALLAAGLEATINRILASEDATPERLARLDGQHVLLRLEGLAIDLHFRFDRYRVMVTSHEEDEPGTLIQGSPAALFAMAVADGDGEWGRPGSRVRISGDAMLARDVERLFSGLEPDWEGGLSQLFGEVIGFQMAAGARQTARSLQQSAEVLQQWAGDYLRGASSPVAQGDEIDRFSQEVDRLRDATARAQARLELLQARRQASPANPAENGE